MTRIRSWRWRVESKYINRNFNCLLRKVERWCIYFYGTPIEYGDDGIIGIKLLGTLFFNEPAFIFSISSIFFKHWSDRLRWCSEVLESWEFDGNCQSGTYFCEDGFCVENFLGIKEYFLLNLFQKAEIIILEIIIYWKTQLIFRIFLISII